MANEIDTRIIQMQFDNAQFEKNIAQSQNSIEDLKEAMDFEETSRALDKFSKSANALSFEGMAANLQKLADKFTGLGDIGEYILSRIRYSIESAARSMEYFIRSISIDQISVGQSKHDALNKSVQTIIAGGKYTEQQAYDVMERVMVYTDQTSHSFSTMVGQISALQSIGMGLGEAELFLEGIANAATKAGAGATEAAGAMSIMSKVVGGTKLGRQQFDSLNQTYRVITEEWRKLAIESAVATGDLVEKNGKYLTAKKYGKQVEVVAGQLENTLAKGWFTPEVAKELYKKYQFGETLDELAHPEEAMDSFGKTAYLTGQRALTFADSLNAIKESVSSGWMDSFRIIFGDVSEAMEFFTNMCDRVIESLEQIKEFRNNMLRSWRSNGGHDSLMDILLGDYWRETEIGATGFMDLIDYLGEVVYEGLVDFAMLFGGQEDDRIMSKSDPTYFAAWLGGWAAEMTKSVEEFLGTIRAFFDEEIDVNGVTKTRLQVIHDIVTGITAALQLGLSVMSGIMTFGLLISSQLGGSFDTVIGFLSDLGLSLYDTADELEDANTIQTFFTNLATSFKPVTDGINTIVSSIDKLLRGLLGLDDENVDTTERIESIGGVLTSIADIISGVAGPILTFVGNIIGALAELFNGDITKDKIRAFGATLGESFTTMMSALVEALPESFGFLKTALKDLFGLWGEDTEHESNSFFAFLNRLFTTGFSGVDEFLNSLLNGFSLSRALETGFGFASAFNFIGTVIGWFKNMNLYTLFMAFLGVASLVSLFNLINAVKEAVHHISGFFADVGGSLKAGFLGEYEWFSEKFLRVAQSIALLAASIFILGSMDPKRLLMGTVVLLGVIFVFKQLVDYVQNMNSTLTASTEKIALIGGLASSIAILCIGLSVLMLALLPISSDFGRMITALIALAGVLTIMGVFMKIMLDVLDKYTFSVGGGNQWAGIGKMAAMLMSLSIAVAIIAVSIGALMTAMTPLAMTGWDGLARAVLGFMLILASIGIFIKLMLVQLDGLAFNIGGGMTNMASIGKMAAMMIVLSASVSLLAVGIGLLVTAIIPLSLMSWGGFVRAIAGLGLVMTELGLMIKAIQVMSIGDKSISLKIAGLTAFAFGIGVLMYSLIPLSMMSWGGWARVMSGLFLVLGMLAGMIAVVQLMGKKVQSAGLKIAGLAGFAAGIGILMFSLTPLASMDWGGWARSMSGLAVVLLELIGFMVLLKTLKLGNVYLDMMGLLAFSAGIWLIMQSLKPLSEMDQQGYYQAVVGLATIMLEIVVLLAILDIIKPDLKSTGSTALLLIGLGLAMIMFSIAFNEIKNVPVENIIAFAAGLSVLLFAIALAGVIAKAGGIQGMLILAVGLAAILGVVALMAPILIGSIARSLADMGGYLTLFSENMSTFADKMNGVSEDDVDKGSRVIEKVKDLISGLIGYRFAGAAAVTEFTNSVARLNLMASQIRLFSDKVTSLSDDAGVGKARGIVQDIKKLFTEDLTDTGTYVSLANSFSTAMYELGTGLATFDYAAGDVEDPENSNAMKTIKMLAESSSGLDTFTKLPIETLTARIFELGGAMMIYAQGAESIAKLDPEDQLEPGKTPDVTAAVELLQAISTSLGDDGITIPDNLPDETKTSLFGSALAGIAGALIQFEEAGIGLGDGKDKALEVLTFFRNLKERLELTNFTSNLSALDSFGTGEEATGKADELALFGKNISSLAVSMGQFANSTTYLDENTNEIKTYDYSNATTALEEIAGVANKLPKFGDALSIITGTREDLGQFATEIELLGGALKDFHINTTSMDEVNTNPPSFDYTPATTALSELAGIYDKLPNVGGVLGLWEGDPPSFTDLAADIIQLSTGLNKLGVSLQGDGTAENPGFNPDLVDPAIKSLESMVRFMNSLQTELPRIGGIKKFFETIWSGRDTELKDIGTQIGGLGDGLSEFAGKVKGKFSNTNDVTDVTNALDAVESVIHLVAYLGTLDNQIYYGSFESYAANMNAFLEAFTTGYYDIRTGETRIAALDSIITIMQYVSKAVAEAGNIDMESLNMFQVLTQALLNLAQIDITKDANFEDLGLSIAAGVQRGIENGTSTVIQAAVNMALESYKAAKAAIDSSSPSKLFMQLGQYSGEGMALGIIKSTSGVTDSAEGMSEKAYNSAATLMAEISRIMAEGVDSSPTITPVLDLSNVKAGMSQFNRGMNGKTIGLNTSLTAGIAGSVIGNHSNRDDSNQNGIDLTGIYTRMTQLGQTIEQMGNSIHDMKIVLDSGAIVGGVTDGVDTNIGRKTFYARRRN